MYTFQIVLSLAVTLLSSCYCFVLYALWVTDVYLADTDTDDMYECKSRTK